MLGAPQASRLRARWCQARDSPGPARSSPTVGARPPRATPRGLERSGRAPLLVTATLGTLVFPLPYPPTAPPPAAPRAPVALQNVPSHQATARAAGAAPCSPLRKLRGCARAAPTVLTRPGLRCSRRSHRAPGLPALRMAAYAGGSWSRARDATRAGPRRSGRHHRPRTPRTISNAHR